MILFVFTLLFITTTSLAPVIESGSVLLLQENVTELDIVPRTCGSSICVALRWDSISAAMLNFQMVWGWPIKGLG